MNKTNSDIIFWTTLRGAIINVFLMILKYVAGFIGHSVAMIADATHSLSDIITDLIVLIFSKLNLRKEDDRHDYGRGRIETLVTIILGFVIFAIGIVVCYHGIMPTIRYIQGETPARPGYIALVAAIISIVIKEWAFRSALRTARKTGSVAVESNAWHHRADSFSSFVTAVCIACAIFLNEKWTVIDPVAAIIVGLFIMREAVHIIVDAANVLIDKSLPDNIEQMIAKISMDEEGVTSVKNILTRQLGRDIAIEIFVTMPGDVTVRKAHQRAMEIEKRLHEKFGEDAYINIHIDPSED